MLIGIPAILDFLQEDVDKGLQPSPAQSSLNEIYHWCCRPQSFTLKILWLLYHFLSPLKPVFWSACFRAGGLCIFQDDKVVLRILELFFPNVNLPFCTSQESFLHSAQSHSTCLRNCGTLEISQEHWKSTLNTHRPQEGQVPYFSPFIWNVKGSVSQGALLLY